MRQNSPTCLSTFNVSLRTSSTLTLPEIIHVSSTRWRKSDFLLEDCGSQRRRAEFGVPETTREECNGKLRAHPSMCPIHACLMCRSRALTQSHFVLVPAP
jgi:hypothetical protein